MKYTGSKYTGSEYRLAIYRLETYRLEYTGSKRGATREGKHLFKECKRWSKRYTDYGKGGEHLGREEAGG